MSEFDPHSLEPFWNTWNIDSLIGTGGFGSVYKIYREEFGKKHYCALKIISIPRTAAEEKQAYYEGMDEKSATQYFRDIVEVIYREIAIMAELKGKTNIVSYEDHEIVQKKDGVGFHILIRMELLESLNDYVLRNDFTNTDVINMGKDLCKALILCQKRNLIHRDIKPGNIFVSSDGDYKLGDFGIARQMEGAQGGLTIVGTLDYMAPEVYSGNRYDERVDIYSLGMVLYYFLNGKKGPFSSTTTKIPSYSERQDSMVKRFSGKSLPAPALASNRLSKIILKACEYDPNNRYQTPEEIMKALEALNASDLVPKKIVYNNEENEEEVEDEGHTELLTSAGNFLTTAGGIAGDVSQRINDNPPPKKSIIKFIPIFAAVFVLSVVGIIYLAVRNKAQNEDKTLLTAGIDSKAKVETNDNSKIIDTKDIDINEPKPTEATEGPLSTPEPTEEPSTTPESIIPEYMLELDHQDLTDLSSIENISMLTDLSISYNRLISLDELKESVWLDYLSFQNNSIKEMEALSDMKYLSLLNGGNNQISDLEPISDLTSLEVLILSNNEIRNIDTLHNLEALTVLGLDGNKDIVDITVISNFKNLNTLMLSDTGVTDISPLYELKNLKLVSLSNTEVPMEQIRNLESEIPECLVDY